MESKFDVGNKGRKDDRGMEGHFDFELWLVGWLEGRNEGLLDG